ncbi:translation protein SH3-like domain-containing protein [Jackrogersella minutella]|nr:translation protein SH3-like domain-containing protein [Jackrogersella minutella]
MITQSTRRPLSSWKAVLRRTRQQRRPLLIRSMATEITPTPTFPGAASTPPGMIPMLKPQLYTRRPPPKNQTVRSAFAIWPRVASARKVHPEPLTSYHLQQMRRLDRTGARTELFSKKNPDSAKPGDVLQITTRKGTEPFAGVCLSIRRAGVDTAVLLRNHVFKVPVEMWFKVYSPNVLGIEIVWRRPKRARRARLTYMRQPKHDMGNVDHLVEAWRRTRNVFTSKGKGKGKVQQAQSRGGKRR